VVISFDVSGQPIGPILGAQESKKDKSLFDALFVRLFFMWQTDLKSLIAYSSVAHMSMVTGDITTLR
jgi:hypothetical protein